MYLLVLVIYVTDLHFSHCDSDNAEKFRGRHRLGKSIDLYGHMKILHADLCF